MDNIMAKDIRSGVSSINPENLTRFANTKSLKAYMQDSIQSNEARSAVPNTHSITNAEQLGATIHQYRLSKNISQADLADLASISVGTIKNAEQGRNIGIEQMFAIVRALGINLYA